MEGGAGPGAEVASEVGPGAEAPAALAVGIGAGEFGEAGEDRGAGGAGGVGGGDEPVVEDFAGRMEVVGKPEEVPPVQVEVQAEVDRAEGRFRPLPGIERFAFYDMARQSFAVIQTGERRFYGCFMLRKGVIPPEA